MKNVSKVMLIVGAVLGFVYAATYLIIGIVFLCFTSPEAAEAIKEGLQNGSISSTLPGTIDEQVQAIQLIFGVLGGCFIPEALLCVANGVIALLGLKKDTKGLYIVNIVFGFITMVLFNAVGGILGVIAKAKENRQ